jgi:serine/threonine-protein kinase
MSDPIPRLNTALEGRYRIERELGAGGMATVYLAEDLRHHRKVAVKVLRPELAAVLGAERFLKEIEVTANLQHAHILPLFDSGVADSFLYYVMPYVEGESLREKLNRDKQLPVEEAVRVAEMVASALDYAHRHDVIHRDIKPENILLHDGQALVADFGIALAVRAAGGDRLTETGLSLGTPQYMSPEQATAERDLDARSDVYSLGCVVYEMLVGDPPHTGSTAQVIISKVITQEPQRITAVRKTVPGHVERAVHKALMKLPADRFATASRFAEALTHPSAAAPQDAAVPTVPAITMLPSSRTRLFANLPLAIVSILAILSAGAAIWGWMRQTPSAQEFTARFVVALAPEERLAVASGGTLALSPDGRQIVYVGLGPGGPRLYVRAMDQLDARPIPGTDGAASPFFSPDGRWVGFYAEGKLKKVALAGGPPLEFADAPWFGRGASWGSNDIVLFTPTPGSGLHQVPAGGGMPQAVSTPDNEGGLVDHRWPEFLPGGTAVVVTCWTGTLGDARIGVLSLETGAVKCLPLMGTNPHYAHTGHLVYAGADGSLMAVPFDLARLELTGTSVPILDGVDVQAGGAAEFALSRNGSLVYVSGASASRTLVTVDRQGMAQPLMEERGHFHDPRFAPDGRRVALTRAEGGNHDVWVHDLERGTLSRLTFEGYNGGPIWTPDDKRVTFTSNRAGTYDLFWTPADRSAPAEGLLIADGDQFPASWSPDGRSLVLIERSASAPGGDIWVLPLEGDGKPWAYLQTPFDEQSARLSPDGRWLAYSSDDSGRREVYVQAFPQTSGRWQVSTDGGTEPLWSRDGQELFYRSANKVVSVAIETEPVFGVGTREVLFEEAYVGRIVLANYDIHPDGERFVMIKTGEESGELIVVLNWFEELRRRVELESRD